MALCLWISFLITIDCLLVDASKYGYETLTRRGIKFPCAWLETGGFFDPHNLYVSRGPFVQSRSRCKREQTCSMGWLPYNSPNSLTFKLIGTDDMRDYDFQAHFCYPVYDHTHQYCRRSEGETAFQLQQIGTWMTLTSVFCRCNEPAEIDSISYSRGVKQTDVAFRGNHYQMTCNRHRECIEEESCYVETPSADGLIYGGKIMCLCPPKFFCPIYFIRDKRVPHYNQYNHITHFGLKCKKRAF